MEPLTKDESKYLNEHELSKHIYSGDLRTDSTINITEYDKLYHMIKEK